MKRIVPLTAALISLLAFCAPASAAPPNWAGFYIGGHLGYGWGDADVTLAPGPSWTTVGNAAVAQYLVDNGSPTLKTEGLLGGVQAGYNFQRGNYVFGIETDFSFSDIGGARNTGRIAPPPGALINPRTFAESDRLEWLATVRGRLGYATHNLLLYATGGVAFGRHEFSQSLTAITFNNFGSTSDTKIGWTIGGGLEHALGRNWTAKIEYLYVDLGSVSVFSDSDPQPGFGFTTETASKLTLHTIRAGLNYKFDWGGPTVAK